MFGRQKKPKKPRMDRTLRLTDGHLNEEEVVVVEVSS